jgi:hypothetical protein
MHLHYKSAMSDSKYDPVTSMRVPRDIKAKLAERAAANRRSVTQEVIVAIEHYLATVPDPKKARK